MAKRTNLRQQQASWQEVERVSLDKAVRWFMQYFPLAVQAREQAQQGGRVVPLVIPS